MTVRPEESAWFGRVERFDPPELCRFFGAQGKVAPGVPSAALPLGETECSSAVAWPSTLDGRRMACSIIRRSARTDNRPSRVEASGLVSRGACRSAIRATRHFLCKAGTGRVVANVRDVTVYTDGACLGNPGPGGYGVVLLYDHHRRELSGGFDHTTNNRMEMVAAVKGLEALKEKCKVTLLFLIHL